MKSVRKLLGMAIVYAGTFPIDIVGWLVVLLVWALWGRTIWIRGDVIACEMKQRSWPVRTWYRRWNATTIGHAVFMAPRVRMNEAVWSHEMIHVEQIEGAAAGAALVALVLACCGWTAAAIVVWCASYPALFLGASLSAWARGKPGYDGSVLERAAYVLQDPVTPVERGVRPL